MVDSPEFGERITFSTGIHALAIRDDSARDARRRDPGRKRRPRRRDGAERAPVKPPSESVGTRLNVVG